MLVKGETELGKWSVNYFPPKGGKYSGRLILTNMRLLFIDKNSEKLSVTNILLSSDKSEISSVSTHNKLLTPSVNISIKGRNHVFSKLFFNTKHLIKLIKS